MIQSELITYLHGAVECRGYIAYDTSIHGKRPGILVGHAWFGQNAFAREKAEALARLGYVGFAIDMYGQGSVVDRPDEAEKLMLPFIEDRALLYERINAALCCLKEQEMVDQDQLGAIGYCFGGTCVIELAKMGAPLQAAVSFHGVFGNPFGVTIKQNEPAKKIPASLLFFHGYKDPFMPREALEGLQSDLASWGTKWEMTIYGNLGHAFTNPDAKECYDSYADQSSWHQMTCFFQKTFVN